MDAWTVGGILVFVAVVVALVWQLKKDKSLTGGTGGSGTVNPPTRNEDR